jgi:hypothetical protein
VQGVDRFNEISLEKLHPRCHELTWRFLTLDQGTWGRLIVWRCIVLGKLTTRPFVPRRSRQQYERQGRNPNAAEQE